MLFLTAYSAKYIYHDSLWWTQLLGILLPQISLLVLLLFPVVLLAGPRLVRGAFVVLLLLVLIRFGPTLIGSSGEDSTQGLKVITFNNPYNPAVPRENNGVAAARFVINEDPHLAAFQESYMTARPGRTRGHPAKIRILDSGKLTLAVDSVGNVRSDQPVMTKMQYRDWSATSIDGSVRTEEDDEVARVVVTWRDKAFALYNVHLASYGEEKPWRESGASLWRLSTWVRYLRQYRRAIKKRARQSQLLVDRIDAENLPVVVVGDFNSTPHNRTYGQLSSRLKDAFVQSASGLGYTYHARKPFARIDFVLVGPEFRTIEARVGPRLSSDHRPLIAVIDWK